MSNIKEIEKQTQIAVELGHTYHKYDLDDAKEYLKWLSFIPKFQQENIDNILKKDKDNLTQEEA